MDERAWDSEANRTTEKCLNLQNLLVGDGGGLPPTSNTQPNQGRNRQSGNHEPEDRSTVDDYTDLAQSDGGTEAPNTSISVNLREIFRSLAQHQNCSCHLTQHAGWSEQAIDSTPGTPMLSCSDHCSGYSSFGASARGSFFGNRSGNISHSDSFSGTYSPLFFAPTQPGWFSKTPFWPSTPVICQEESDLDIEYGDEDIELPTLDDQDRYRETTSANPSGVFDSLPIPDVNQLGNEFAASVSNQKLREEAAFVSDSNGLNEGPDRHNSTFSKDAAVGGYTSGSSMNPQVGSQRNIGSDGSDERRDQPGNEVEHDTQASRMIQQYLELAVSLKHAKDQLDELEVIYHTEISESSSTSTAQQSRERRIEYENQKALKSDHLDQTIKSVGEARLSCIMNAAFDPLREHVVDVTDRVEPGETAIEDERLSIIREILKSFERDETSSWLVTPLLSQSLLRDVRAWARLYGFGYKTLVYGSEEQCSVLIHKDREQLLPKTGDSESKTRLADQITSKGYNTSQPKQIHSQPKPSITKPRASCDNLITTSFGTPQDDTASCISRASVIPKKRRVAREDGGFNCLYPECQKSYNRACDLAHHERNHYPKERLPHVCQECGKKFLFPKDLRRHQETHMRG